MIGGGDALALRDRGMIGDTATAALVAADGTIDWWCPGRFDADATFFRLLDPDGGAVRVGPAGPPRAGTQSYDERTNVLRTVLAAGEGELEVTDLMPWDASGPPPGRIVRIVTARRGPIDVELDVIPGHRFGPARRVVPFSGGIAFDGTVVRTDFPIDGHSGRTRLDAGERIVITIDTESDGHQPLTVGAALDLQQRTSAAWRHHTDAITYDGPYRNAVVRSLLTLKALTWRETGAVVAAATTSLPEMVGGERNWDYRYTWVRDSSLGVDAAYDAGLVDDANAFTEWMLRVLEGCELPLAPVYAVDGELLGPERELPLAGWRRSQPVRVGNGASDHLQLDLYADIVSAMHVEQLTRADSPVLELWDGLASAADWLCDAWKRPDRGIWELRGEPRHLTTSKLSCWYTLDRMVELARAQNPLDLAAPRWLTASREIARWLQDNATGPGGALCQDDSGQVIPDAALLRVVWRSPWPDPTREVTATVDLVLERLSDGPFVRRYDATSDDGLPAGEGAFLACSFWAVEALARLGRWEESHERMEALVAFSGPLGLLPEEADPRTGDFLGNLPQAFSHLALVQAALALADGPR